MALDKKLLEESIIDILTDFPKARIDAAKKWADAYYLYSFKAKSSVTVPTLNIAVIQGILTSEGDFLELLSMGITSYWYSAAWIGTGFTGVTSFVPVISVRLASVKNELVSSSSTDKLASAKKLSNAIDSVTRQIKVTLTNTTSGATTIDVVS